MNLRRSFGLKLLLICGAILTALMLGLVLSGVAKFTVATDIEQMLPTKSSGVALFRSVQSTFGGNLQENIAVDAGNYSDPKFQQDLRDTTVALLKIPGIKSVLSPAHALSTTAKLPLKVWNKDRTWGRFIIELDGGLSFADRTALHKKVDQTLTEANSLTFLRSGASYTSYLIAQSISAQLYSLLPTALLLVFLLSLLYFRSLLIALKLVGLVASSTFWGLFPLSLSGIPLGLVSQLAPTALFALSAIFVGSVAWSLVVLPNSSRTAPNQNQNQLNIAAKSVLLCAVVLICGLLTLALIDLLDVRRLAILMIWGTIIAALFAAFITPLVLENSIAVRREQLFRPLRLSESRSLLGLVTFAIVLIGLYFKASEPRLATALDGFIPQNSSGREQLLQSLRIFPSDKVVSIIFERVDGTALNRDDFTIIRRIVARYNQHPDAFDVVSYPDVELFNETRRAEAVAAGGKNPVSALNPASFLSSNGLATRVMLETRLDGQLLLDLQRQLEEMLISQFRLGAKGLSLKEEDLRPRLYPEPPANPIPLDFGTPLEEEAPEQAPPPVSHLTAYVISGNALAVNEYQAIVTAVERSALVMAAAILALVSLVFRSRRASLLALAPVLISLISYFSVLGVAFDEMTVGTVFAGPIVFALVGLFCLATLYLGRSGSLDLPNPATRLRSLFIHTTGFLFLFGIAGMIFGIPPTQGFSGLAVWTSLLNLIGSVILAPFLLAFSADGKQLQPNLS